MGRLDCFALVSLLALAGTASPARATVRLSGQVTRPGGAGVGGVDIDAAFSSSGDPVTLANDGTDPGGFFQTDFPGPSVYDIFFNPPLGSSLVPGVLRDVPLLRDSTITVSLAQGFLLSGRVTQAGGAGVAGANIDMNVMSTGEPLYLAHDRTDLVGNYSVAVPAGTYEVIFLPPSGTRLVAQSRTNVAVQGNTTLNVMLPTGVLLSGTVHDSQGNALPGVDLDVEDATTGDRIITPHDNTNSAGAYSIVVPTGFLTVEYAPPAGTRWVAVSLQGLSVAHDLALPVTLRQGKVLSGRVVDSGDAGIAEVDLNVDDLATGRRIPTPRDNTDAQGNYSVVVPTGTYSVTYRPPALTQYVAIRLDTLVVSRDLQREIVLPAGWIVSGHVRDGGGAGIADVDLDATDPVTLREWPTPNDDTDSTGLYRIVVPASTWDLGLAPMAGAGFLPDSLPGLLVDRDLVVNRTLAPSNDQAVLLSPGVVSILPGESFLERATVVNNSGQMRRIQFSLAAVLANGHRVPIMGPYPSGGFALGAHTRRSGNARVQIPAGAPRPLTFHLLASLLDSGTGDTLATALAETRILDPSNPGAAGSVRADGLMPTLRWEDPLFPEVLESPEVAGKGGGSAGALFALDAPYHSEGGGVVIPVTVSGPEGTGEQTEKVLPPLGAPSSTVDVVIEVFNLRGQRVRGLWRGPLEIGRHPLVWDGRDQGGRRLPAGLYLCRASAGGWVGTRRVVVRR